MNAMFRSLALYNYRLWFIGALVSSAGMWMQSTAQSWVVLTELTDNDAAAVGITMTLQFAPQLFLVPVTGWVADRFDRRKLLLVTQTVLALLGVAVGVLLLTGAMNLLMMYALAAGLGVITAFDNPARQAFVSDLVAQENMSNAVALNSASFNMSRMVGPALAGVVIVAVGTGWVFLINAATFGAMIIALLMIRTNELTPRPTIGRANRIADGFRYVARRPDLLIVFLLVFVVGGVGMNFPIIASTMALEFGQGADGFGLLNSFLAIGSLIGALMTARRVQAQIRVVMWGTAFYAVAAGVSAFMPSYWLYAVTLLFTGFAVVTILATANAVVQVTTTPALRGRVLAVYMAVAMGGTAAGAPVIGWITAQWSPRAAILAGAGAALAVFLVSVIWLLASGRVGRVEGTRFRLTLNDGHKPDEDASELFSDQLAAATPIDFPDDEPSDALASRLETTPAGRATQSP